MKQQWKRAWSMARSKNSSSATLANIGNVSHIDAVQMLTLAWTCRRLRELKPKRSLRPSRFMLL